MALARPAVRFEDVYEEHVAFVWRTTLRLGVDPTMIDDVVQEVFIVVHRRLSEFEGRGSIRTWLFGIVRRVAAHARRSARRKPSHLGEAAATDLDELVTTSLGPCESAEQAEELRLVQHLLNQLDDDKREAFVLAELEQMTIREISEAVGANPNTVASRIRAARAVVDRGIEEWDRAGGAT
ncbi:MAG TPA: sigma-70 family RNA polymerase sigma factor [Labilithrix sp.]|jgi:RNA polymerase sigma-70 factor (ECF subfamily)|nr:sigma-70 family RNA polymerase sigma factor [Labilithrix sp.]